MNLQSRERVRTTATVAAATAIVNTALQGIDAIHFTFRTANIAQNARALSLIIVASSKCG
jgi:hypothetical protein